jgi:hypothetical protein
VTAPNVRGLALAAGLVLVGCSVAPEATVVPPRAPLPPRAAQPSCVPRDDGAFRPSLSATGCFPEGEPAADLVPYTVRSPLWSDGSLKRRWMVVPPGERLGFSPAGAWAFPAGSLLVKQFLAASDRPIETRFMAWDGEAWTFATYRHEGEDAALLPGSAWADVTLSDGAQVAWYFPDAEGCATCHLGGALGPVAAQLDTLYDYGDGVRSQLDELARVGLLDAEDPAADEPLPVPSDPSGGLEDRARSWLHANCAHCHRPDGWTPPEMTMDLRYTTAAAEAQTCGVPVQFDQAPEAGRWRVAPGVPDDSAVWGRIALEGPARMPPVGTARLDPVAEATVRAWIAGLSDCPSR